MFLSGCPQVGMDTSQIDQFVYVKSENLTTKYMVHILFHVLGRYHEHQRNDRDQYIIIDWDAVHQGDPTLCIIMYGHVCTIVWKNFVEKYFVFEEVRVSYKY